MPSVKAPEIAVVGDAMINYHYWVKDFPKPGDDVALLDSSKGIGGSAANTAIGISVLGGNCAYCGCIGEDEAGKWLVKEMSSRGVDTGCMDIRPQTGYVLALIDSTGERTMFSYRGEPKGYTMDKDRKFLLRNCKLMHLSAYSLLEEVEARSVIEQARMVKDSGGLVSLDTIPNIDLVPKYLLDEMFGIADILLPNRAELQAITGEADIEKSVAQMLQNVPCIALKLGGKGSLCAIGGGFKLPSGKVILEDTQTTQPVVPVTLVDSTGAGDSFNAGFLAAFMRSDDPDEWLKSGNRAAAKVVSTKEAGLR